MNRSIVLLATAVALAAAPACSGDDGGGELVPTLPDATVPSTTPPTPSVTDEPATTATTAATTPPSTTAAPPPTTAPDDVSAIAESYGAAWAAYRNSAMDPTDGAKRTQIGETMTGSYLITTLEIIDLFVANRWEARPSLDVPADFEVEEATIAGSVATAIVCQVNSDAVVAVTSEGEQLVDDSVASLRYSVEFELVEGAWMPSMGVVLAEFPGEAECGA